MSWVVPRATWDNWDLILSTTTNIPCSPNGLRCTTLTFYGSPGHLWSIVYMYLFYFPGAGVWFTLNGTTYQNNSLVTLEDVGEWDDALLCVTDNTACCSRAQSPGMVNLGDWYYPNGTGVVNSIVVQPDLRWEFYRNRGQSVVRMNRRRGGVNGTYHCEIPNAAGVDQTIYIGVYTAGTGEWYVCTHVLFKCNANVSEE